MAWYDGWKGIVDPGNLLHHDNVPQQPGVGGQPLTKNAARPQDLQLDPLTGRYFDPVNGTTYADKNGTVVITNPNVAQQAATATGNSESILGDLNTARSTGAAALNGQGQLVNQLDRVAFGKTPSVAQNQLTSTLGGIQRTQESQASGIGGANAFAAQRAAAQNIGNAQIAASQQAATLRAQETATAMQQKGNVLNSIAGNSNTQAAQDIQGGNAFANTGANLQEAQQGLNQSGAEKKIADDKDRGNKVIGALATIL